MEAIEILYDVHAEILSRYGGNGIGGRIVFEAKGRKPFHMKDLQFLQMKLGYHPSGYGCLNETMGSVMDENGYYWARWSCSNSCD